MKQDASRANRRHKKQSIKKQREKYFCVSHIKPGTRFFDVAIGILTNTAAKCSCILCGNPRKYSNEISRHEKSESEFQVKIMD